MPQSAIVFRCREPQFLQVGEAACIRPITPPEFRGEIGVKPSRNPVALVTGGRRGLGQAIAFSMAEAGFHVVVNDLVDDEGVNTTLSGIRERGTQASFVQGDIADVGNHEDLVAACFSQFGTIDCLVNNAGISVSRRGDILETTIEDFDAVMRVNLRGTFFFTTAIARRMLAENRHGGECRRSIISISSTAVRLVVPQISAYGISKTGLSAMTRLLAQRLAADGIYVHEVQPGAMNWDISGRPKRKYSEAFSNVETVPMQRWCEPSEVGKAVASLAAGALPFATGESYAIDGGLHLHVHHSSSG